MLSIILSDQKTWNLIFFLIEVLLTYNIIWLTLE